MLSPKARQPKRLSVMSVPTVDFSRVTLGPVLAAGMAGKVHTGFMALRGQGPTEEGGEMVEVAVKRFYCDDLTEQVRRPEQCHSGQAGRQAGFAI